MIEFELSDEYLTGYNTRLNDQPFDDNETDDWRMGWLNANQTMKFAEDWCKRLVLYRE